MHTKSYWFILLMLPLFFAFTPSVAHAQEGNGAGDQSDALLREEADAVYYANLERRAVGAPPLRWNVQLTTAARWFSWDSVVNRPTTGYCGHQDTQGNWPGTRARNAGYPGASGAENAYCGYLTGEEAVHGWMDSPGHRANLLDPNSREVGLGYYRSPDDGRGYVTQDFGHDVTYAPVVIDNEALASASGAVELYIYDAETTDSFQGRSANIEMQVSNDICFTGASWEPFTTSKAWLLADGVPGWRTVYVKTRDRFQRSAVMQDSIYYGADVSSAALAELPLGAVLSEATLYDLDGGDLPLMQFSLGWLADERHSTFHHWWGAGAPIDDSQAWGGAAYRLTPGDGESFAWVWDTTFIKDTPFIAYFRLKVDDNTSDQEVARISVKGGGAEYGPRRLKGNDFTAPDSYQEFAVPFTFHSNPDDEFLIFQLWRSGEADVTFDTVTIFTAPQPVASPYTWRPPGGVYRGQGVWVRYTDGANVFSAFTDAAVISRSLTVAQPSLAFTVGDAQNTPAPVRLEVTAQCVANWHAQTDTGWIELQREDGAILVSVDPAGLTPGLYAGEIAVVADDVPNLPTVYVPVTLHVIENQTYVYLPTVER